MIKVPIELGQMKGTELLKLARACIREFNDQNLTQFKLVEK